MGETWQSLLDYLIATSNGEYRTDPDRDEAHLNAIEYIVQTMLEALAAARAGVNGKQGEMT